MDFFAVHEHWLVFIICMMFLPRITMLLTGICFFPWAHIVLFWFGWVLAPRLTVAILACWFYFHTNPVLCTLCFLWALGGEGMEKEFVSRGD